MGNSHRGPTGFSKRYRLEPHPRIGNRSGSKGSLAGIDCSSQLGNRPIWFGGQCWATNRSIESQRSRSDYASRRLAKP